MANYVKVEWQYEFGSRDCDNLDCDEYMLNGSYWTVTTAAGIHEFYM